MTSTDQTATDAKLHTETVTVESRSKYMDKVLPLLASTKDITRLDGYAGALTLDTASIKVAAAAYGSSSRTVTANYTWEVSKTTSDTVAYTVIFGGTPIQPVELETAPFGWSAFIWQALPIGAGVVVLTVVLMRLFKSKRKGRYPV